MRRAPYSSLRNGCCNSRWPTEVVPTTNAQSATASATVVNSSAEANNGAAPTAERASRNATSYGFTTRSRVQPKLAMARAAAPMFNGFRGATKHHAQLRLSEKNLRLRASRCIFLLTFFSNNLIYESHCDFRIAKFDVRENQSMKSATKKAAPKKKAAREEKEVAWAPTVRA